MRTRSAAPANPAAKDSLVRSAARSSTSSRSARTVSAKASVSASASVERGVNEARMGGFVLIFATGLGTGLSVGLSTSSVLFGIVAGLGAAGLTTLLLALIYRVRFVRHAVMDFMHRI